MSLVVWGPADAPQARTIGHRAAHKQLKALRDSMCTTASITAESRDVSDGAAFDWKAYISSRDDLGDIVGPGISRVEGRFLAAKDPNWKSLKVPNRFDILVHRVDGSFVRIHPESVQHGRAFLHWRMSEVVVHGSRANDVWPLYEIPPEEAFDPSAATRGIIAAIPRSDTISAKQAHDWLTHHVLQADAVPPPPDAPAASRGLYVNWVDLYDAQEFRWHQFLAARDWGKVGDVIKFGAAKLLSNGKPVFFMEMADGQVYYVTTQVKRGGPADKDTFLARLHPVITGGPSVAPAESRGGEVGAGSSGLGGEQRGGVTSSSGGVASSSGLGEAPPGWVTSPKPSRPPPEPEKAQDKVSYYFN